MIDKIHPIPAFSDNYIWTAISSSENKCAVVDPGDATPVIEFLEANGLELTHILITHHHPDHTGGLKELIARYAPIVYGPEPSGIAGITHFLHEGDEIELYGTTFNILEVPGHTLDHIAYNGRSASPPILFCGDTLFAAGCGRIFEGTPVMMEQSLSKLSSLDPSTQVYCTHEYTLANLKFALAADGKNSKLLERIEIETERRNQNQPTLPSTIALELETNPFLRCEDSDVVETVSKEAGISATSTTEVFAALRSWKDRF